MNQRPVKAEATITERVRLTETDPYGIAHHSVYPIWAEMGLRALLSQMGGSEEPEIVGFDCKYLRSARAGDELKIRTWPSAQSVYRFEISRDRVVLAMGTLTVAGKEQA